MTNIGIFDSGLGGVAVLNELSKKTNAKFYYLGDNLRVPYGDRSKAEITSFATDIVGFLEQFDIDFYIIACNTISVTCKDYLRDKFNKNFIAITDMAVKAALEYEGDFLALATRATIDSHFYKNTIESFSDYKVYEQKAAKIVGLIEEGILDGPDLEKALDEYLVLANEKNIPNIILACTHYPIIKDEIRKRLTYDANIIDPAVFLANNLETEDNDREVNIFMSKESEDTTKLIEKIMDVDYKLSYIGDLK